MRKKINHDMVKAEIGILNYAFQLLYNRHFHALFEKIPTHPFVKAKKSNTSIQKTLDVWLAIPATILLAFAVEIALKELIYCNKNQEVKWHDLSDLFSQLDWSIQETIRSKCIQSYGDINSDEDFDNQLKKSSDAFVEWRYVYEQDSSSKSVSNSVLHSILITVSDLLNLPKINILEKLDNWSSFM